MMENLRKEYWKIYNVTTRWCYCSKLNNSVDYDIFSDEQSALSFVEDLFTIAGKNSSILLKSTSGRHLHSVSVFFLGIYIKEKLFPTLLEPNKNNIEGNPNRPGFLYFWFLTSLYHDFGYVVEQDKKAYTREELDFDA